jgi:hypothetical protein
VLRGLLFGLFGFVGFFLTLSLLIEHSGITIAFLAAITVTLIIHGISLLIIQTEQRDKEKS